MATFSGTENFDSYSNGSNLLTQNGGSGWTGAWTRNAGFNVTPTITATNAQSVSSPNSATATCTTGTSANVGYDRVASTPASGASTIIHASLRMTGTSDSSSGVAFELCEVNTGSNYLYGLLRTDGTFEVAAQGGGTVSVATGLSQNTWYHCWIDIDATNKKVRGYVSTTIPYAPVTWSSYTGALSGTFKDCFNIWVQNNTGGGSVQGWIDDIRDGAADFVTPNNGNFLAFM